MSDLARQLLKEQRNLLANQKIILKRLETSPEGRLRVSSCRGTIQYYHVLEKGNPNGKYISVKQKKLIQGLAQKEYDKSVLAYIDARLPKVNRLLAIYQAHEMDDIYDSLSKPVQNIINPVQKPWKKLVSEWMSIPYKGNDFHPEKLTIDTLRGEKVRSKAEAMIADYLYSKGIPYKYECPLTLSTGLTIYPDFTILSPRTRQEVYIEHEGMMGDPVYASQAVKKIKIYEKNHIYPGDRLILSFETDNDRLDRELLGKMIKRCLYGE